MQYKAGNLVTIEPPDPEVWRPYELPGSDLPAMITWVRGEEDREKAFDIRRQVFVDEQGYTEEQEFDAAEDLAIHALVQLVPGCATTPGAGRSLGTARLLVDGSHDPPLAYISRLSVLPHARRLGVGRAIVQFLLDAAEDLGCANVRAGAQLTALEFWGSMGFEPTGERYMDFHVPHEWTQRRL